MTCDTINDETLFDKLTMTPLIAAGGGLIGAIIALLIWAGERLKAYRTAFRGNLLIIYNIFYVNFFILLFVRRFSRSKKIAFIYFYNKAL